MAYLLARAAHGQVLSTFKQSVSLVNPVRYAQNMPKITYKPFEKVAPETHLDRNTKLNRPMSPHLTIYQPQLTSILSLTHRTTGIILSTYFIGLGLGALTLSNDVSHYITMLQGLNLSSTTLVAGKFLLALPFAYHLANGVRHLLWDTARFLTIKQVYSTGYFTIAATFAMSILLATL